MEKREARKKSEKSVFDPLVLVSEKRVKSRGASMGSYSRKVVEKSESPKSEEKDSKSNSEMKELKEAMVMLTIAF